MPQIDEKNVKEFVKLYNAAAVNGDKEFKFEGHDVLVAWAKHVIEYFAQKGYVDIPDTE